MKAKTKLEVVLFNKAETNSFYSNYYLRKF